MNEEKPREYKVDRVGAFFRKAAHAANIGKALKPSFKEVNRFAYTDAIISFYFEMVDTEWPGGVLYEETGHASAERIRLRELAFAKAAWCLDFLEGEELPTLQQRIRDYDAPELKDLLPNDIILSVAQEGAAFARQQLSGELERKEPAVSMLSEPTAPADASEPEVKYGQSPDLADPQDVIKYLFEIGIVSPSHAAALLVAFGFERPAGEISERLENDIKRIKSDLRARIAAYRTGRTYIFEFEGIRVIEAFLALSEVKPQLQLKLPDADAMTAVGSAIVALHLQRDVRQGISTERPGKYSGTGTIIDFGE